MMINHSYLFNITILILVIIINSNVLSVTSQSVPNPEGNSSIFKDFIERANAVKLNVYEISINEEYLRNDKYCSGKCDGLDIKGERDAMSLEYRNRCTGNFQYCLLDGETEERKNAEKRHYDLVFAAYADGNFAITREVQQQIDEAKQKIDHTGNICKCLCERANH
ncbi:uncharacterized protein LOC130672747 [Microplitis mediator]|uniref:uncharacterized protein LOC130672747 n=1 Tax=Microplitis mediator TaxID=375433 RepID=UPI002552527E|nr:uncharacterized protein LOC130672747 [Microplitis mediator]